MADKGKGKLASRLALLAALIAVIAAFKLMGLDRFMSFEYIKQSREGFAAYYSANAPLVIGLYMSIYIAVTALSLPGAAVLTLAGGALFGLVTGTIVVSFASTIGATLAFLVSRFLLRDWVQGSSARGSRP